MSLTAEKLTTYSVEDAARILQGVTKQTDIEFDSWVGRGNQLHLKLESEQVGGTFKTRGIYVGAHALYAEGVREFVMASAGNASAAGAYAARRLGMSATMFMPKDTPDSKVENTQKMGGNNVRIQKVSGAYDEAADTAETYANPNRPLLHAFDGEVQIAGQGTMTNEILHQVPDADVLFVPVGGGSVLAGALQAIEEAGSNVRVIAVQLRGNDSMERSVKAGRLMEASRPDSLAEGSRVRRVGYLTLTKVLSHRNNVEFMTVGAEELGREVTMHDRKRQQLTADLGSAAFAHFPELTALLAPAGARLYAEQHPDIAGQVFVAAVTGSNSDYAKEQMAVEAWHTTQRRLSRV